MVMLQQTSLDKEEKRILAMRARAQSRTERFLNARSRTIGVDVEGLNQQVEEKRQLREAERKADADQAAYDQHIGRVLEQNEADDRAHRLAEMHRLRDDLLAHAQLPKNTCEKMGVPIDPENCGTGAAQYFSGEDKLREERIRIQQAQMRQWTSQQIAEKNARSTEIKEESLRYDQYLNAVDQMRGTIEDETAQEVSKRRMMVRQENENAAKWKSEERQRLSQLNDQLNDMEADSMRKSAFLNEDTEYGKSALADYRVRPDNFKGYNKEQIAYIFKGNQKVQMDQMEQKQKEIEEDMAWAAHQENVSRVMEASEQQDKEHRDYMNKLQTEDIQRQRAELKAKQQKMKEDKFGAIGEGFFQGFGTSCR